MLVRRPQTVAVAGALVVTFIVFSYLVTQPVDNSGASPYHLQSYFSGAPQCPDPLRPAPALSSQNTLCQSLSTNPNLGVSVQICFAPDIANQGYFLVSRNSAEECAIAEAKNPSLQPEENRRLRLRGPDVFHISVDGEQRWAAETEPEYLGSCQYKYPFNFAFAGPMNVTIWRSFSSYRAVDETQVMSLQWDMAESVLGPPAQIIKSPASAAQGCSRVWAIPSLSAWRSTSEEAYLSSVPECSRHDATAGRYLRAHWSEPHTFNGYMYQPDRCRWSRPISIDALPGVTQAGWQPHNVLFFGDSHVRYAYDIMSYIYEGNWTLYNRVPVMKALKKTTPIGPLNMTFIWDAVLREMEFQLTCENLKEFDIVVLGSSHHNLVMTKEKDHDHQFTVEEFRKQMKALAQKLSPDACPGQPMPRVIWIGNPARPVKISLPPEKHPLNHGWRDARVNPRLALFNHDAWEAFRTLPGSGRVNLYELSLGMANHFVDGLHMIMTDVQAAFAQELHQKLWLDLPAYAHSSTK